TDAEVRSCEVYDRDHDGTRVGWPARDRPHSILGANQSGNSPRPADAGRVRGRAGAVPVGAESGASRSRLGLDAHLRRGRYRSRRRRRRRHRGAAGTAFSPRAGQRRAASAARGRSQRRTDPLPRVNRAGTHLLGLINQVLDLSKIEAGKLELNPQTVQLAPLINEVIGTAGQLAEQNKNRLIVDAQENLGALTVDPM